MREHLRVLIICPIDRVHSIEDTVYFFYLDTASLTILPDLLKVILA